MVKYLSFHNSSFALRYFQCKWQGHSMTHPLFIQFLLCLVCHDLSTDHNPEEKFIPTTVACAIGPSVNAFRAELIFHSKPNFLQFV
jgi:hypothetical protein